MRYFLASARRRRLVINLAGLLLIAALAATTMFSGAPATDVTIDAGLK
jgi:hypothetical protein